MAELITGLFLIGIGLLVVKYPMLISGYNTMPKVDREKIDIRSYSVFMKKVFVVMGLIIITGGFLLRLIGQRNWFSVLGFVTIITGCGLLIREGRRLTKNTQTPKFQKWSFRIAIAITLLVFLFMFNIGRPAGIEVKDNTFIIHNSYGVRIPIDSITDVEITDELPTVTIKSNGLGFGNYQKGYFQTKEFGTVMLFFHSGHGPYLVIKSTTNPPVFINRNTKEEIETLYRALRSE